MEYVSVEPLSGLSWRLENFTIIVKWEGQKPLEVVVENNGKQQQVDLTPGEEKRIELTVGRNVIVAKPYSPWNGEKRMHEDGAKWNMVMSTA